MRRLIVLLAAVLSLGGAAALAGNEADPVASCDDWRVHAIVLSDGLIVKSCLVSGSEVRTMLADGRELRIMVDEDFRYVQVVIWGIPSPGLASEVVVGDGSPTPSPCAALAEAWC